MFNIISDGSSKKPIVSSYEEDFCLVRQGLLERKCGVVAGLLHKQCRRGRECHPTLGRVPRTKGFRSAPYGAVTVRTPALAGGIYSKCNDIFIPVRRINRLSEFPNIHSGCELDESSGGEDSFSNFVRIPAVSAPRIGTAPRLRGTPSKTAAGAG